MGQQRLRIYCVSNTYLSSDLNFSLLDRNYDSDGLEALLAYGEQITAITTWVVETHCKSLSFGID